MGKRVQTGRFCLVYVIDGLSNAWCTLCACIFLFPGAARFNSEPVDVGEPSEPSNVLGPPWDALSWPAGRCPKKKEVSVVIRAGDAKTFVFFD